MTREEALRLIALLLREDAPADEKRVAAARLSELIRILLPENLKKRKNDMVVIAFWCLLLLCITFIKVCRSWFWKMVWVCVLMVTLGSLLSALFS